MLDGIETVNMRWHKLSVRSMNRYITQTEKYIQVLEQELHEDKVKELRESHHRSAPSWKESDEHL